MRSDKSLRLQLAVSSELGELRRLGSARRIASAPPKTLLRPPGEQPARKPAFVLSDDEEVTLRRVAYGQSEVRVLRAADLERLRRLRLIEDRKDGPCLTAAGKHHFDGLPRGVFVAAPRQADHPAVALERAREEQRRQQDANQRLNHRPNQRLNQRTG